VVVSERRRARLPGPVVVGREGRVGGGRGERRAVGRLALGGWEGALERERERTGDWEWTDSGRAQDRLTVVSVYGSSAQPEPGASDNPIGDNQSMIP
jgi:hypothetical protein